MNKIAFLSLVMFSPLLQAQTNITACQAFAEHIVGDELKNVSINQPCRFILESIIVDVTVLQEEEADARIKIMVTEQTDAGDMVYPASEVSVPYGQELCSATTSGNVLVMVIEKQ